jgi:WD40 repeat protein
MALSPFQSGGKMKKIFVLILIPLVMAACAPVASTPTETPTHLPTQTPTAKATATATPSPTNTPTPSITPAAIIPVTAHPLALNKTNAASGMQRLAIYGKGEIHDLAWSPNGLYLAVATGRGIYLYDATSLEEVRFFDTRGSVTQIAFHPDNTRMAFANCNQIGTLNIDTGAILDLFDGEFPGCIHWLAYGRHETIAAIGMNSPVGGSSVEGILKIWDASTHERLPGKEGPWHWYLDISLNPDGSLLVIYPEDLGAQDGYECSPSYDGGQFALCIGLYPNNYVRIFDLNNRQTIKTIEFSGQVFNAAISPDGRSLALMLYEQQTVIIMDIASEQQKGSLAFTGLDPFDVGMLDLDGETLYIAASGEYHGRVLIWNLSNGEIVLTLQASDVEVHCLALSPDRRTLAVLDENDRLSLWDLPESAMTATFDLEDYQPISIIFSPDGRSIYFYSNITYSQLALQNGRVQELGFTRGGYHIIWPIPFLFSPGGDLITWDYQPKWYGDIGLLLTNHGTGETLLLEPYTLLADNDDIHAYSLSPDGNFFVVASTYKTFVWDLPNHRLLYSFSPHAYNVNRSIWSGIDSMTFSPQTDLLVSTSFRDRTTQLWNIRTGQLLRVLNVHGLIKFTPDGRLLVTAGDGVIRVWGLPPWP